MKRTQATHFRDMADWSGTTPKQLIEAHLERPANTRRGYEQDLWEFAHWMECKDLPAVALVIVGGGRGTCKRLLMAWINQMRAKNISANTIRRRIAAVTSMISLAQDLDVIGWQVSRLPLPPIVRTRDCKGPSRSAVERMFIACQQRTDVKGRRDEAILALLYFHGLRANEALSLRLSDVDMQKRTIHIMAKRGTGRLEVAMCQRTTEAIEQWIDARGDDDGPLFRQCRRGRVMTRRLTYEGLRFIVAELGNVVGVRCWPHALRHAAISHLALYTGDSPTWGVAFSRHRDVKTWMGYQDHAVSHVSAAEVLSKGQIVRHDPPNTDN